MSLVPAALADSSILARDLAKAEEGMRSKPSIEMEPAVRKSTNKPASDSQANLAATALTRVAFAASANKASDLASKAASAYHDTNKRQDRHPIHRLNRVSNRTNPFPAHRRRKKKEKSKNVSSQPFLLLPQPPLTSHRLSCN